MLLPEFSRTQLVEWVRDGSLTLDGRVVPAKQRVFGGEAFVLNAALPLERARWDVPQIVRFDACTKTTRCWSSINRPGVVVHPGAGNPDHTLVNGLLQILPELATASAGGHRAPARQRHEWPAGRRQNHGGFATPDAARCRVTM